MYRCLRASATATFARTNRRPQDTHDTWTPARYLVTFVEGTIMLARTYRDQTLLTRHLGWVNEYLAQNLGS